MKTLIYDRLGIAGESYWNEMLARPAEKRLLDAFLQGEGPPRIFAYYQEPEEGREPLLMLNDGETVRITRKAVFFSRTVDRKVNPNEQSDQEVLWGEVNPDPIRILSLMMENVFEPMLAHEKSAP